MLYVAGVEEDEKNHIKFCKRKEFLNLDTLSVKSLRQEWQLQQTNDTPTSSYHPIRLIWEDTENGAHVVKVGHYILYLLYCTASHISSSTLLID